MLAVILFLLSFCLVFGSSYFFTTLIKSKRFENSIIYFSLIFVSQVIFSIEILSLIKQITPIGVLIVNIIIFALSLIIWKHKNKPHINLNHISEIKKNLEHAIKKDKILLLLSAGFLYSSLITLFFVLIVPTNSWDSMDYHLARIGFWLQNHTLAHFETSMLRQLIYSINSEILILWPMVFLKRDFLAIFPQFFAYLGSIFIIYSYLSYFKVSYRRIIWTIFIFASLPAVIIEASSAQTNLLVAFFLFCSLYLFIYGVKENDRSAIIFSAIAFSIDLGIKYSTFFFIPVFGLVYLLISVRENKKNFYKPLSLFILASIPAFLILSSYNYVLNYIDFRNFFGPQPYIDKLSTPHSFNAVIANLIRYFLLMIDFTGIKIASIFTPLYLDLKDFLFSLLELRSTDGLVFNEITELNTKIHENCSKLGLIGFLLFIPLIIRHSFTKIISLRDKTFYLSLSGLITISFLVAISIFMGFCYWNNRFLLSAFAVSSIIFAFSYTRKINLFKIAIVSICLFNYLVIPTYTSSKPLFQVIPLLAKSDFISFRNDLRLRDEANIKYQIPYYYLIQYLSSAVPDNSKIGLIFSDDEWYYPFFEENLTWKIFLIRYDQLVKMGNYNDYDYIVISGETQDIDIFDEKQVVFNYKINGKDIIYNKTTPNEALIMYFNKDRMLIDSGKPVIMNSIINFSNIPPSFKLVKTIRIMENYRHLNIKKSFNFSIYKKVG